MNFRFQPAKPPKQYTFSEALALLLAVQAARQMPGVATSELVAAIARLGCADLVMIQPD